MKITPSPAALPASPHENLFWIDLCRALVMFGVIIIHTSADVITEWGRFPNSWWWAANIYDSLVRGCVPVFVMLSGALLLGKQEDYKSFFTKRFQRIAIPFAAWLFFYLVWKKLLFQPELTLPLALSLAAGDKVHFHLWFLYMIAGLYLFTPILRLVTIHASRRDLLWFLGLWFTVSSALPFIEKAVPLLGGSQISLSLPIPPAEGFVGYFLLGYFLHKHSKPSWVPAAFALWLGSFLLCLVGTFLLSTKLHTYQKLFYDNFAPNVVLFTASFFVLIKHSKHTQGGNLNPAFKNLVLSLSKASFGIYLVHPMILEALNSGRWGGFVLKPDTQHPVFMIPICTLVIYLLSFGIITLLQKTPGLRRTV